MIIQYLYGIPRDIRSAEQNNILLAVVAHFLLGTMIVSYDSYRLPDPGVCCSSVGVDAVGIGKVFSVLFLTFFSFSFSLYKNSFTKHNIKSDVLQYHFLTCTVVLR